MVVEAAPVIPGEEDRGRVPRIGVRKRLQDRAYIRLPLADLSGRVLAHFPARDDPGDRRKRAGVDVLVERIERDDVPEFAIIPHGGKPR